MWPFNYYIFYRGETRDETFAELSQGSKLLVHESLMKVKAQLA